LNLRLNVGPKAGEPPPGQLQQVRHGLLEKFALDMPQQYLFDAQEGFILLERFDGQVKLAESKFMLGSVGDGNVAIPMLTAISP
jgi:hypothetical protein